MKASLLAALLAASLLAACGDNDGSNPPTAEADPEYPAASYCEPGPGDQPETGLRGAIPAAARNNPDGFQGFWCGARKVAQNTLFNRGSFGDLQLKGRCAYASNRDPSDLNALTTGTVVFDVKTPSQMVVAPDDANPNGKILRTRAMIRAYSAFEVQGNVMVSAFKDNGPNGTNPLDVYDISDCLHPVALSTTYDTPQGNHDGWLTPDGKTYYGIPFSGAPIIGTNDAPTINTGRIDVHVTDLSDPKRPKPLLTWNRLSLPKEVQENPQWKILTATHFHDVSTNEAGTRVYMALYGGNNSLGGNNNNPDPERNQRCANGLLIMDSSDVANRVANPQLKYISFLSWCDQQVDPDFGDGSSASTHATEYVKHENGKEYIVTTDESGGGLGGTPSGICAQRTYARMIDISDEEHPLVVGTYKPDANKPENCEANLAEGTWAGMSHYIGFDDRNHMRMAIYASAYAGMRFVDWRDPTDPKEIAYYVKPRHTAGTMDFTRPDARYDAENCLYYTGWNQGGLVSVELTNPAYNPCMSRSASVNAQLNSDKGSLQVSVEARRHGANGPTASVSVKGQGNDAQLTSVTRLGSAIDACGPVAASAGSVQIDGSGTFNGAPATFRTCVHDDGNNNNTGSFYFTCTSGCSFTASGPVNGGKLVVGQTAVSQKND